MTLVIKSCHWFTETLRVIGIIVCEDDYSNKTKAFIGTGYGRNDTQDAHHIMDNGARITKEQLTEIMKEVDEKTITITPAMGGEIEDFLNLCKGKMIQCFCIGDRRPAENFKAYSFSQDRVDGLKDKDSKRWWVYWHCPHCGTDLAFWKVKNRLQVV